MFGLKFEMFEIHSDLINVLTPVIQRMANAIYLIIAIQWIIKQVLIKQTMLSVTGAQCYLHVQQPHSTLYPLCNVKYIFPLMLFHCLH